MNKLAKFAQKPSGAKRACFRQCFFIINKKDDFPSPHLPSIPTTIGLSARKASDFVRQVSGSRFGKAELIVRLLGCHQRTCGLCCSVSS